MKYLECTTRKCGWIGAEADLRIGPARHDGIVLEAPYVCPECGNEEHYVLRIFDSLQAAQKEAIKRRLLDGRSVAGASRRVIDPGQTNGFWAEADWLLCRDGEWRPVEPGTFPLADGHPGRVGQLRAYGNALNAEAATEFVRAAL